MKVEGILVILDVILDAKLQMKVWMFLGWLNSSVIRQRSESQHGCFNKTKQAKFSEKETFLSSLFSGKFGMLFFLKTPVLRFALLPYYQRTGACPLFGPAVLWIINWITLTTQPAFTCSWLTIETLEQGVKYVQS